MLINLDKTQIIRGAVDYSLFSYGDTLLRDTIKSDSSSSDQWCYEFVNVGGEKILYFGIAGTNDISDLIRDINLIPVYCGFGFCHFGFLKGAKNILRFIDHVILNAVQNKYKIVFTGHSYGGAVAQIVTEKMLRKYPEGEFLCVSFGSPRVWTRISKIKSSHIRVFNDDDPVTKIPLVFGLYTHKEEHNVELETKGWIDFKDHSIYNYKKIIKGEKNETSKNYKDSIKPI